MHSQHTRRAIALGKAAGVVASLALAPTAQASEALARKSDCLGCHAVATKLVGPAYKDVAAKYAGKKDAESMLVTKIIKGGSGSWGAIPMPANPQVSDADARILAKWILAQK